MAITAALVQQLRERSGAGMMECKKALEATGGDIEQAFDHLRKQGLKSAEKKAGRETGDGRVFAVLAPDKRSGALVCVSCETDFAAGTADFEAFLKELAQHVLKAQPSSLDELLGQKLASTGTTVQESTKLLVGKLGENIQVAGARFLQSPNGCVGQYVHHNNKVGTMVAIDTDAPADKAEAVAKDLCMHIAFSRPAALERGEINPDEVERERAIYLEEVKSKPADIQDKIVQGKLEKFFAGKVLPEQPWFKDDKLTVSKVLASELGKESKIAGFACFVIGS